VPLLWAAFLGRDLEPITENNERLRYERSLGETILTNSLFGVAPVLIFLLRRSFVPSGASCAIRSRHLCRVLRARMAISDYGNRKTLKGSGTSQCA